VAVESDLTGLLADMREELLPGQYVFISVGDNSAVPGVEVLASVTEPEGLSLTIAREQADQAGLSYDFVAAWIALQVHSALYAVGLTAAVSSALAEAGVSCNVIAGYHHDHLLVPFERGWEALTILRALVDAAAPGPLR